jgi:GT2 family glycosyltransferase
VQRRPFQIARPDFARIVTRKFAPTRLLLVGSEAAQFVEHCRQEGIDTVSCAGICELDALSDNGAGPFDIATWFYPAASATAEDVRTLDRLSALASSLVLIPATGADAAKRRPPLVAHLETCSFFPNYDCDISDLEPAALQLTHEASESAATQVRAVEGAFSRLNRHMRGLERRLRTRMSELEAADRHIATLEQKLLKLKEAKRELKQLKQEKQALRKSPERKIGQILLAPYRLPQKLVREVRKKFPKNGPRSDSGPASEYQQWFEARRVKNEDIASLRDEARGFASQPCISIITPVFDTPVEWLTECVESVLNQIYEKWELILVDDASTNPETLRLLPELAARDTRILLAKDPERGGISAASNCGLSMAQGDWVAFLDHDDILEPDALFQNVKWLQDHPDADLIYSDEDKLTEQGFDTPIFKPDWSPDYFLSCNYVCHLTLVRRELVREVGGFRSEFDGAQDYDLFLRITERTDRIHHIARVLYHWRRSPSSTADNIRRKPGSLDTGRQALEAHLARRHWPGHVTVDWRTHAYWVKRELTEAKRISLIIPVRDRIDLLARCLESVISKTTYAPYEIVVVDNDSQSAEAREYFARLEHRVLHFSGPFNYSAINNFAVENCDSPWLLFLNDDIEVIDQNWLTIMAEHVQRPEVGAVGPRLLYPDDTVQHAGVVVGVGGIAEHAFRGLPAESPGVCRQLQMTRNYSAVTGACLLTRRDVFEEIGGFDEERLPVAFNDVDLCLKMRRAGYLIVYTPFAKLYHHESASRRRSVEALETEVMRERWPEYLQRDPYYNPNLSRERADFSLGK